MANLTTLPASRPQLQLLLVNSGLALGLATVLEATKCLSGKETSVRLLLLQSLSNFTVRSQSLQHVFFFIDSIQVPFGNVDEVLVGVLKVLLRLVHLVIRKSLIAFRGIAGLQGLLLQDLVQAPQRLDYGIPVVTTLAPSQNSFILCFCESCLSVQYVPSGSLRKINAFLREKCKCPFKSMHILCKGFLRLTLLAIDRILKGPR